METGTEFKGSDITGEILKLEKRYWDAMRDQDLQTAMNLTYFPCTVTSEHGVQSVDREQFKKMFNSNEGSFNSAKIDESKTQVRQIGPDTAVIAYSVHASVVKDGKTQEIDAVDTSTWVKRNDKWVCAMHTETLLH